MWKDVWEWIWAVYVLEWCRLLEHLVSWTEFTMKSKYLWACDSSVCGRSSPDPKRILERKNIWQEAMDLNYSFWKITILRKKKKNPTMRYTDV